MNDKKNLNDSLSKETQSDKKENSLKTEDNERKKLDPTRYGDWEVKGIAVDF